MNHYAYHTIAKVKLGAFLFLVELQNMISKIQLVTITNTNTERTANVCKSLCVRFDAPFYNNKSINFWRHQKNFQM